MKAVDSSKKEAMPDIPLAQKCEIAFIDKVSHVNSYSIRHELKPCLNGSILL